jgi:hypothetical protein
VDQEPLTEFERLHLQFGKGIHGATFETVEEARAAWEAHRETLLVRHRFPFAEWAFDLGNADGCEDLGVLKQRYDQWRMSAP